MAVHTKAIFCSGIALALAGLVVAVAVSIFLLAGSNENSSSASSAMNANAQEAARAATGDSGDASSLNLSDSQLAAVKVEPVEEHEFPVEKEAVGSIDFNEDMETQVFTPYQGRILGLFAAVGDDVKKGQTLFTIDSPDLLTAESNLIAAAGGRLPDIGNGTSDNPRLRVGAPRDCGRHRSPRASDATNNN